MTSVAERVIRVLSWSAMTPAAAVTPATAVASLALGSLEQIECVLALEDEFQLELPDPDLRRLQTVQDVVDVVERALARQPP
jgi:acyl carrier protein